MGPRPDPVPPPLTALARFEVANSPEGLFQRYLRGRRRHFLLRQTLTVAGAASIGLIFSQQLGLWLAGLGLAGDLAEWLVLGQLLRRDGRLPRVWAQRLAIAAAYLQALTIAACVILAWRSVPFAEGRFFAATFLVGAVINAGLARPQFRPAADARLLVYVVTTLALLLYDAVIRDRLETRADLIFALALALLWYMSALFIRQVERSHRQRTGFERALLAEQEKLRESQAELAALVRQSHRLALVARHANDAVIITDSTGRIDWVNDAFTRTTGYSFADAIGRSPGDLLNAAETSAEALAILGEARAHRTSARVELINRCKDGRLVWVETSIAPILGPDGRLDAYIGVERDITLAKEREAELAAAREAALAAARSKALFLANMSHEIRTPMNGVIGVAELLSETALDPQQQSYVETIVDSGQALLTIINDILDLTKLQSGKMSMEDAPFDPAQCVERTLSVLRPAADKKGIALQLVVPETLPWLRGDEGRVRQILLNLVGNAIKFTERGAVTLHCAMQGGSLRIAVQDSGIGIPADRLGLIFESFTQADTGTARQFGGTGLGLTISRLLAEQMGGRITVDSTQGKGSVFTVDLALPEVTALSTALLSAPVRPAPPASATPPDLTVLVAEDNRTNMMILRKMLHGSVARLIEAGDGAEAVERFLDSAPDLILMDVSMPVMDGLAATRAIRAHEAVTGRARTPILALTANAFAEDRAAALSAGLDGFLSKPLAKADLLAAIRASRAEDASTPAIDPPAADPATIDPLATDQPAAAPVAVRPTARSKARAVGL